MKKIIYLIFIFHFWHSAISCDICGGFNAATPYKKMSTIGLVYKYRAYQGYYPFTQNVRLFPAPLMHGGHGTSTLGGNNGGLQLQHKDYEVSRLCELRARILLSDRIETQVNLPFSRNALRVDSVEAEFIGMGDISVLLGYHLIEPNSEKDLKHRLIIGGGIKLATGKHHFSVNPLLDDEGNIMAYPGSGSWDGVLYAQNILQYKKVGLFNNTVYKLNTANHDQMRIANGVSSTCNVFYVINVNEDIRFIPTWTATYDYTKGLYSHKTLVENSYIHECMTGPQVDMVIHRVLLSLYYQRRLYQQKSEYSHLAAGKFSIGIHYLID